jgi:hypothetical protein
MFSWRALIVTSLVYLDHATAQNGAANSSGSDDPSVHHLFPAYLMSAHVFVLHSGFSSDPILHYRPRFAHSYPTQLFVTGIILTLACVLIIHLIFTVQYHWRLARANYILQMSAALSLLGSLIASMYVILNSAIVQSQEWPFMLEYIAVDLPPLISSAPNWSMPRQLAWLIMNATTFALIQASCNHMHTSCEVTHSPPQITHIQFLTLMYPSGLEAKLIFLLLGMPLWIFRYQ